MTTSPKLLFTLLEDSQVNAEVAANEATLKLEGMSHLTVLSCTTTTPAVTTDGTCYVIPASGSGAFASHDHEVAVRILGQWYFIAPQKGMTAYVQDDKRFIYYVDATLKWVDLPIGRSLVEYHRKLETGTPERWYTSAVNGSALTTGSPAIGTIIAVPFVCNRGSSVIDFGINVTTGGSAGSKARVGIYDSNDKNLPGNLIYGSAEFTTTSTGVKSDSGISGNARLKPGRLYWLAYLCGVAAPTIRCHSLAGLAPVMGHDPTMDSTPSVGWTASQSYGAMPSGFPGSPSQLTAVPVPAIYVKLTE